MPARFLSIVISLAAACAFGQTAAPRFAVTPDVQSALGRIRADSLRGDLSFIASDLLEGRDTPSRGLDVAAEYIAAQFRRAGLQPGGDDGYFQSARMDVIEPQAQAFTLRLLQGESAFTANSRDAFFRMTKPLDLDNVPLVMLNAADRAALDKLTEADLAGKVAITLFDSKQVTNLRIAAAKLRQFKPALAILVDAKGATGARQEQWLSDPEQPETLAPRITLTGEAAAAFYASLKPGVPGGLASVHIGAPARKPVTLHNVIGILRGSDPALRDTAVLLTAHYDHIGMLPAGEGDRIYNGANDDGSGTVSVMEVARALAALKQQPRRSIVFIAFFGEEKGLMGSRYYARHPAWPLAKTVAQLNLEQVGRTDATDGKQLSNASVTGFDYSTLTEFVERAGDLTGIKIYKNARNSDPYFADSDNLSLAEAGVPAHTLCVAFDYPDEHKVGDEWQKIDYDNMAKVDRAVALSLWMLANSDEAPKWNEANPKTAPYVKALKERQR